MPRLLTGRPSGLHNFSQSVGDLTDVMIPIADLTDVIMKMMIVCDISPVFLTEQQQESSILG